MEGRLFDIQRFSVHDGPSIRTTVFMKGCPLRCQWCHNPEGLIDKIQLKYIKSECIGCDLCGEKSLENVSKCPSGALQLCGYSMGEEELLEKILQDRIYYKDQGGVTFSGGECLLQAEFVSSMLKRCKEEGIHTAIDTSGYVDYHNIEQTLPYCDLYLYDIKMMDEEKHQFYTGVSNRLILENLVKLSDITDKIWIRIPVIPDVNDKKEDLEAISSFLKTLKHNLPVTLIPYHSLAVNKYEQLGLEYKYHTETKISNQQLEQYKTYFQ